MDRQTDEEEQVHQEQKMNKPWEPASSHNTKSRRSHSGWIHGQERSDPCNLDRKKSTVSAASPCKNPWTNLSGDAQAVSPKFFDVVSRRACDAKNDKSNE
jgi:hypothetical protein